MHRILIDEMPGAGDVCRVMGEEARHAVRVKRLEAGESVELLDGRGRVAGASVRGSERSGGKGEWSLLVDVLEVREVARVRPRVEVFSPAAKGDRLEEMIDGLSQVGAASWSALRAVRGGEEPRGNRVARLHRIAREAAKQCGRAWSLEIGEGVTLSDALEVGGGGAWAIMADASGGAFAAGLLPAGAQAVRLLIGPEGGWEPGEVEQARRVGALVCGFGPHVMRIEQAGVVAAGILLHEMRE